MPAKHSPLTDLGRSWHVVATGNSRDALLGRGHHPRVLPRERRICCSCCCSVVWCWRLLVIVMTIVIIGTLMVMMDWTAYSSAQFQQHNIHIEPAIIRHIHSSKQPAHRLPQCIVIGVRKAGTTALLTFLDMHPDIVSARDEVHFFDREENFEQGMNWYLDRMPLSTPTQLTMEKSPAYFVTEEVPGRIHAMNSSIKLLLIVREPTERAVSDYVQLHIKKLSRNKTDSTFEELVVDATTGTINVKYPVIDRSLYDKHLETWLKFFSLKQIHVVDGNELINNPPEELAAVESFLGISHHLTEDAFKYNHTRGFYCMQRDDRDRCLADHKGNKHPEVDSKVIEKLQQFFRPHNERFFHMVNRTFSWPPNVQ